MKVEWNMGELRFLQNKQYFLIIQSLQMNLFNPSKDCITSKDSAEYDYFSLNTDYSLEWTVQDHQHLNHNNTTINTTWTIQFFNKQEWLLHMNSFFGEFWNIYIPYNYQSYFLVLLEIHKWNWIVHWFEPKKEDLNHHSHGIHYPSLSWDCFFVHEEE